MVSMQIAALLLAVTGAGETVLYDFQAPWCGPCKMMAPVVQRLAADGFPVRKVDVDRDAALAQRYGVTNIPCFILIVNGQEQGRVIGATSYQRLKGMLVTHGVSRVGEGLVSARGQTPDRPKKLLPISGLFLRRKSPSAESPLPKVELGTPIAEPVVDLGSTAEQAPVSRPESIAASAAEKSPFTSPESEDAFSSRLRRSSVRLKVHDPQGYSFGSGTIINFRSLADGHNGEALILTCGHIFRDSQGTGRIEVDLFDQGKAYTVAARMIRYDLQSDIGLVSIQTDRPVPTLPLASAESVPTPGSPVLSVGCDHGRPPTVQISTIKAVNSFVGPPNLQVAGQPAIGRSGGGLFNRNGELIGVCNFADPTDRAGLYAAVQLAHRVLQQSTTGFSLAEVPQPGSPHPEAVNLVSLSDKSRQISSPNNPSELICIVRSGRGAQSHHQVIVIDNASSELLDRIASERARSKQTFPTSMALGSDYQRRGDVIASEQSGIGHAPAPRQSPARLPLF
jgi:thiol-disulfide isomerase/thioredoxin